MFESATTPCKAVKHLPYTPAERDLAWELLESRGNFRLRLAAALVQEARLSFREICDLKITSFDFVSMSIAVKSPADLIIRWTSFGTETLIGFFDWIAERKHIDNGYYGLLLHDKIGNPLTPGVLHNEFVDVLCHSYRGKSLNDVGLDAFSERRFRSSTR